MKYFVKNCPHANRYECLFCVQNKDCPIKQVVEKCLPQSHIPEVDDLKEQILQILQVEEVEDDTH